MPELKPALGRWKSVLLALFIAMAVMWLTGAISRWGQWYSDQAFYRAQVHAFFEGRLALTHDVEGVTHDLAWVDGGVQQVWGLGVPIWLSLWEGLGRLVHISPFPDRIAMLFAIALMMYMLLRTWLGPTGDRSAGSRGAFLLTAFTPGVLAMMRGRMAVYEEASAYSYGTTILLMVGLLMMIRRPSATRYVLLLTFAGLTGLMRPTVWFYGAVTAGLATLLYWQYRGSLRRAIPAIVLGSALWVAGGGVLYLTNYLRFGKGSEFGHRLNLEDLPGNIYATRFEYPFQKIPTVEAAKELAGGLFGQPEKKARAGYFFYDKKLHAMQSPAPRWREYYFTNYRLWHIPAILGGIALTVLAWLRARRKKPEGEPEAKGPDRQREARWLGLWAVLAMAPLLVFYMRSPSVSSRYFLDIAPSICVLLVIVWRQIAAWLSSFWSNVAFVALAIFLGYSAISYTAKRAWQSPIRAKVAALTMLKWSEPSLGLRPLPEAYDYDDPWIATYIGGDQLQCKCFIDPYREEVCDHLTLGAVDVGVFYNEATSEELVTKRIDYDVDPECYSGGDLPAACTLADPDPELPESPPLEPTSRVEQRFTGGALYRNGTEWDLNTAQVGVASFFFVDSPQYVEVEVSLTGGVPLDPNWRPQVRAKVQLDELELEGFSSTARGVRVRFKGPKTAKYRSGLQVVFLAFGPPENLDQPMSEYKLWRVAWRDRHGA